MNIFEFIDLLADQYDSTPREDFSPETHFKELEDWSSLTALSIIAMVDEECGVSIGSDTITSVSTIQELFDKING